MKTRKQFIGQFPNEIDVSNILDILVKDSEVFGIEVYRALNKLLIKIDGKFYYHAE